MTSYTSTHIYIDGALPHHKHPIRLARLESSLKDLIKSQKTNSKGFQISGRSSPPTSLPPSHLFNSFHSLPHALRGLPASPFLVPAVLDALSASKYVHITEVVPGEADAFCARAARDEGGTVLTSDSDMLVYDIGNKGSVCFFNGLEMQDDNGTDDRSRGSVLKASVHRTATIATRFDMPNLQRLAYEIKNDPTAGFAEAKRRAKVPVRDALLWHRLQEEYSIPDPDTSPPANRLTDHDSQDGKPSLLDPRLSELILQLSSPSERHDATIYLPFLIDDHSRASAWNVSAPIRHALYDVLAAQQLSTTTTSHLPTSPQTITEVSRKGSRILSSTVPLPSVSPSNSNSTTAVHRLRRLLDGLTAVKARYPQPALRTRIFALRLVYIWYREHSSASPPSIDSLVRVLGMRGKGGRMGWEDIHLRAQVEGVGYALRMVGQGMRGIGGGEDVDGGQGLVVLLSGLVSLFEWEGGVDLDIDVDGGAVVEFVIGEDEGVGDDEGTRIKKL